MVTPGGLEPPAYGLGNRRSILLSYGVTWTFCNISNGETSAGRKFGRSLKLAAFAGQSPFGDC